MVDIEAGYFLVDKPLTWTSFQVVNKVKYLLKYHFGKKIKIGHAGTLDPLASGLLILCYGKMTKEIHRFQDMRKEYVGKFALGAITPSFDGETEIEENFPIDHIDQELLSKEVEKMIGVQMQVPPIYSAKRIEGERAYNLARKGVKKELKANQIEIFKFEAALNSDNEIEFVIECSKGTYIRSIAHEMGKALKSGAYLKELRRSAIGKYRVEDAQSIEDIEASLKMNKTLKDAN